MPEPPECLGWSVHAPGAGRSPRPAKLGSRLNGGPATSSPHPDRWFRRNVFRDFRRTRMRLSFPRPWAFLACLFAAGVCAQPAPSLREATEAAWSLTPQARAAQQRQAELDARGRAAASFLAGPPSVGPVAPHGPCRQQRRASGNRGRALRASLVARCARRYRGAGRRRSRRPRAAATTGQGQGGGRGARRRRPGRAGAGRAPARTAQGRRSQEHCRRRGARRVKAGESARVDQLQAEGIAQQAAAAQAQADAALARLRAQWRALTGLQGIAPLDEVAGQPAENISVAAAQAAVSAAQAKLQLHGRRPARPAGGRRRCHA